MEEEERQKNTDNRAHAPARGGATLGRGPGLGAEVPETQISLGQRVTHGKFGEGVVLNYEGQGSNARVEVNFDAVGSKWLVLSYAKLEAL